MSPLLSWLRRDRGHSDERDPRLRGDDEKGVTPSSSGLTRSSGSPASSLSVIPASASSVIPAKAGISGPDPEQTAVVFQAAALVLTYPEAELLSRLDTIEAALDGPAAERFAPLLAHLRGTGLSKLQSFHIQEFDLSRRHALHLSYWTDGDTRRRGEVLAEIKGVYRESGLLVDTGGELPDYLPMVLEFAVADPERGVALLQRFRASVELLRLGLTKDGLPHAGPLRRGPPRGVRRPGFRGEPARAPGHQHLSPGVPRWSPRPIRRSPRPIRHPREGGDLVTSPRRELR
jgi:nitrate reductase delta subunit